MTNYNRDIFVDACYQAGIVPSKRQESKFRNGKGLAFAARISEAKRRK